MSMQGTEFETDEMLKLLTEALRRGPGSPEWHDAVERLRTSGAKEADDYRLLLTVRERLEAGQSYREVRAGPEFTRELMQRIDEEPEKASGKQRTILIVSLVCVALLIGSIAILVTMMSNGQPRDNATEQLSQQLFVTPVKSWTFNDELPDDLTVDGELKLDPRNGLSPARNTKPASASLRATDAIDLTGGACVEAQVEFRTDSTTTLTLALAPAPHEPPIALKLLPRGFELQIGDKTHRIERSLAAGTYTLRMKLNETVAIVEIDGQPIWSGPHPVGATAILSVQFEMTGKPNDSSRLQSLRILKP
jgi:hypothetical protein